MNQPFAAASGSGVFADPGSESVNLAQIWRALSMRARWIIIPTLVAFVAALIFVNIVPPRYTGEAKVLLESRENFYTRPGQERSEQQPQIDEQAVASQVQVVLSRDLARAAVKRLGLVGNPEFDPLVRGIGPVQRFLIRFGLGNDPYDRAPEERVLDTYYDRLLVYPTGRSRVLTIEFRSKDPELSAQGANTAAELYLDWLEGSKKETARAASNWLGPAIDSLRSRVSQAEAKVEEFRARTGLLVGGNNASISAQHLSDLNTQLAQARSAHADAQAKARLIRDLIRSGQTFEIPDVANNELIRRLIEQRVNLRAQLALESRTLLSEHPRIKELNAQLADHESQIRGATERTTRTLENEARIAGSRVETLQAAIDAQKKIVTGANENEVQLRALEREARAEREQLESFLARYREALARDVENAAPPDARIVSRAVVPLAPSFPKKAPIVTLVTLATLLLAVGVIVARELLSGGGDAPALGWAPAPVRPGVTGPAQPIAPSPRVQPMTEPQPKPDVPPDSGARDTAGESTQLAQEDASSDRYNFEALLARLSKGKPQDRGRRILVTSVDKGRDAVDMAKGLGRILSQNDRAIVVSVDENVTEPTGGLGLTDLVAGEASFSDVIGRGAGLRLHFVPLGQRSAEALSNDQAGLDLAMSAFDQTYGWVLCVLCDSRDDALLALFAPRVDAVVIASNADPASGALVDLYEKAKNAGARDVVVAREQAPARALGETA
jgi:polysaccharide biosynthesis transport protein